MSITYTPVFTAAGTSSLKVTATWRLSAFAPDILPAANVLTGLDGGNMDFRELG